MGARDLGGKGAFRFHNKLMGGGMDGRMGGCKGANC
jgi:hypothetical protein